MTSRIATPLPLFQQLSAVLVLRMLGKSLVPLERLLEYAEQAGEQSASQRQMWLDLIERSLESRFLKVALPAISHYFDAHVSSIILPAGQQFDLTDTATKATSYLKSRLVGQYSGTSPEN